MPYRLLQPRPTPNIQYRLDVNTRAVCELKGMEEGVEATAGEEDGQGGVGETPGEGIGLVAAGVVGESEGEGV